MSTGETTERGETRYAETIAEHRRLLPLLDELGEWIEKPITDPLRWPEALATRMMHVYGRLVAHFKREEGGALFSEIPFSFPRFARPLDRLLVEHEVLANDAETILRTANELRDPTTPRTTELVWKVRLLLATLLRHESEEDEILQLAYCDDIGAAD